MERRAPAIVIFTRNRPNLLRRQARFHAEYPGQMIVVDASEQPIDDLRLPPGGAFLHRPGMSMYGRIEAGVAAVLAAMALWLLVEVFLVLRDKTQSPAAA
jgi:hypothetical protein